MVDDDDLLTLLTGIDGACPSVSPGRFLISSMRAVGLINSRGGVHSIPQSAQLNLSPFIIVSLGLIS